MIREAVTTDLEGLLELYTYLHGNPIPEKDKRSNFYLWQKN